MAKATKYKIDGISYDFNIWGINSPMEDYKLCWYLNKLLKWDFKRVEDVIVKSNKDKSLKEFNAYKYNNEIDLFTVEIIQNKKDGNILLPELINFDYIFIFQGEEEYFNKEEITELLREIKGIQSIFELDINNIKSKSNLLFRHLNGK